MSMMNMNGIIEQTSKSPTWFAGFRLEIMDGLKPLYLHMCDLNKTTTDIRQAWVGSKEKVRVVRRRFPHTKQMRIVKHSAKDTLRKPPSGY